MLMWLVKVILQHCRCGYQYLPHTYRRPAMDTWGTKKFFVFLFFFFQTCWPANIFFPPMNQSYHVRCTVQLLDWGRFIAADE